MRSDSLCGTAMYPPGAHAAHSARLSINLPSVGVSQYCISTRGGQVGGNGGEAGGDGGEAGGEDGGCVPQ